MSRFPAVEAVSFALAHVPDLVRYGSKPAREIERDPARQGEIDAQLRSFEEASRYLPNRVFLGAVHPDVLRAAAQPWWKSSSDAGPDRRPMGSMLCQSSLYGLLRCCDQFGLIQLERETALQARECLARQGLFSEAQLAPLESTAGIDTSSSLAGGFARLPLYANGKRVGVVRADHEQDATLQPSVLLENLASKATALQATVELLRLNPDVEPGSIDYVLNTGEEAVGDRYQRGGGNLAKAIAEMAGLERATGSDLKAFCCGPMHGFLMAAALVQARVFGRVLVVGGGSLAKLGMKSSAHLKADMPILEDVLAGFAFLVGPGDGSQPIIRLDAVGKHDVRCKSSAQGIAEALTSEPLGRLGLSLCDVNKYAVELHNPEVTVPAGSGDVPATIYRVIASLAVMRGEIGLEELTEFTRVKGMLGFSPTQGHVASAIPFLGHAWRGIREGELKNTLLIGKGSLFLGRMTQMSDGVSLLLEHP